MKKIIIFALVIFMSISYLEGCFVCKAELKTKIKNAQRKIEYMQECCQKNKKWLNRSRNMVVFYYTLGVHRGLETSRQLVKKNCKRSMRKKFQPYPEFLKNIGEYDGH